jgi:hypothetical protein
MNQAEPRPTSALTRRHLLQQAGLGLLGASGLQLTGSTVLAAAAPAKQPPGPPAELKPLQRFPRMMQDYFGPRMVSREKAADALIARISTRAAAESYVRETTEKVRRCFGPLPEKTPLNPRVTGVVERDTYTIENVIFESRPNFPVTGNLYLPKNRRGPTPAVVGVCGHSQNGKAGDTYQSFAQGLARLGYIVLIIDPIGQGERYQYVDAALRPVQLGNVREHLYVGNQQFLVGEFFGTWQAWDGIRALDYLLTRPEVDGKRIMATGNSGGGTITSWLCALEPRFVAAAPSCFINTFRRMFESEQPADTEQCPPHTLALGLDHADFLVPFIPRHLLLLGQEKDLFDARGLEVAHGRLQHLYTLLGVKDHEALFIGPDYHGYSRKNREAMYGWFNQLTGVASTNVEPALTIEKDETLWCTSKGQVAPLQPATVLSFTRDASQKLRAQRPALTGEALKQAVSEALYLPPRVSEVPDYRILPAVPARRYPKRFAANYAVETEPGILALVYRLGDQSLSYRVPRGPKRAILYVSHRSADAELRDEPLIREVMAADPAAAVFACDVRGIGESEPNTTSKESTDPYGSDYFYAIYGIMFDQPYPGQRTFDLLRLCDWLKAHGHEEIHLVAKGWGTIPATFAALFEDRVTRVTLKHALSSYSDVAEAQDYDWPLSSLVPSALKTFDLPDCYRALAAKQLRQIETRGARSAVG